MKRLAAFLLSMVMVLTLFAGCASTGTGSDGTTNAATNGTTDTKKDNTTQTTGEDTNPYAEKISFSITDFYSLYQASAGHDLAADPYIQWVQEKFNVEIDAWACDSATADEKTRLWINGGGMPDCMVLPSVNVAELNEYADQGLIQGLPEGWEERWPNLAHMLESSGYGELVKVDGVTYAIPHATFGNFNSMETPVAHTSVYCRKDWAKEVAMEDLGADYTVPLSELQEYLKKVKAAGLCDNATLGSPTDSLAELFKLATGTTPNEFVKTDSGYAWTAAEEGHTDYLKEMKTWYDSGLIDKDFYVNDSTFYKNAFAEGIIPVMYFAGGVGNLQDLTTSTLTARGKEEDDMEARQQVWDEIGIAAIASEDGTVYADGIYCYWLAHVFSPDCDEATMERILDMMDWFCTKEGQCSERCAIPGEDFTIDADGEITILNQDIISGEYKVSPSRFFNVWGYCGDDFAYAPGAPGRYEYEQQTVLSVYAVKLANSAVVFPEDDKVTALATTAKKAYSINWKEAIADVIVNASDVDTAWAKFVDTNRGLWEPVVADLNQ